MVNENPLTLYVVDKRPDSESQHSSPPPWLRSAQGSLTNALVLRNALPRRYFHPVRHFKQCGRTNHHREGECRVARTKGQTQ